MHTVSRSSLFRSGRSLRLGSVVWSLVATAVAAIAVGVAACSPSALVDVQSPSGVVDPSQITNATAAAELRGTAIVDMMQAFGYDYFNSVIEASGFLTDELADSYTSSGRTSNDRSTVNLNNGFGYGYVQMARVKALQAEQALSLYAHDGAPGVPRAWQGEMYALEGFTIIWLAELYCSGIPLTRAPLVGQQIPTRGLTTEEMLDSAMALFDSAVVAGADSVQYVNLAYVGKARALLDLGRFASADSVAQHVPTDFVYAIPTNSLRYFGFPTTNMGGNYSQVQDAEGMNGLIWSADPRAGVVKDTILTGPMLWPGKYNVTSAGVIDPTVAINTDSARLADGLEARLIQAEAALARGDANWLTILNTLRANCYGTAPCSPISTLQANALPPLSDPGIDSLRVDTLMKERAMWLYLTGHREGDLRRLVRYYHRDPNTLWPTGNISVPARPPNLLLPGAENGLPYGFEVVFGPGPNEQLNNPLYGGCYDTNP